MYLSVNQCKCKYIQLLYVENGKMMTNRVKYMYCAIKYWQNIILQQVISNAKY